MIITYYGHACFEVEVSGKKLLFDPFISPNELAKNIDITSIKPDYILISHGHEDHVADAVEIAKQSGAKVISNFEIVTWLNEQAIENCHPMNHGGKWEFEFGVVKMVNAVHSSGLPDGSYGGNPAGFVIESQEGNFYFAGDTALTLDMQLIGKMHDLDFAVLPIGDNFTMGIDEAVIAAEFIQCDQIIGVHYDTFGFIKIDHNKAIEAFKAKEKQLHLIDIGHSKEI